MEVLEKYDFVEIRSVIDEPTPLYIVQPPKLTAKEEEYLADHKKIIPHAAVKSMRSEVDVTERWETLKKAIDKKITKTPNHDFLLRKIAGLAMGYGEIGILIDDDNLEEVMVNGMNLPVFVYHRRHGMCKTNLVFSSLEAINELVTDICYVNEKEVGVILDIAAVDGNRINVTNDPLPSRGPTITIRKQRRKIFSIVELIEKGTISSDLAAFMWLAVEGMKLTPANMIIAGSIGSGKTTMLNALCTFIPPNERVITIEDTFELNLENLENKVQMESKKEYDMDALLRDSLRMRADRVIIGEIRGKEAMTLFNAMSIGRIGMGTLHASSAREVVARLENDPMRIPANVVGSLDLILIQNRFVHEGQVVRRITEVAEVTGAIKDTVMMGQIYEWDPKTDTIARSQEQNLLTPILFLDKLSEATKLKKEAIIRELDLRKALLEYMLRKGIKEQEEVKKYINRFYLDLRGLISDTPDLFPHPAAAKKER